MGRCAEGFSDRSWIAKQAHAMIFGERHKHIYCLRQSLAIVGQITLLRDREIQSVEQFLSEQGKNPRRHAAGPAASRKLSSFAMVRSGGFGSSSFKLRGERIRQAPHSSGLELLLLRIRVEFVYPPRRMPQDLVRSACPTGRKRLVKRREASLTISGCWQPARLREISARLCTPLCKSVEQSRPARDVGIAPSTANHWLSMLEASGQVVLLEPWFSNRTKSIVRSPKLYLADTGLLCALLNIRSEEALRQSPAVGAVWETFVFAQLRNRERCGGRTGSLFFWRDRTREVDFVADTGGRLELIEAKSTELPDAGDTVNLDFVRNVAGKSRVAAGAVVCRANGFPLANGFRALPVTELA
jgi:hypothetical protein